METFWIVIVIFIVIVVVGVFTKLMEEKKRGDIISNLTDFSAADKYISQGPGVSVALDTQRKKVCFLDKNNKPAFYNFADILTSEIDIDGETVLKQSVTGTLGRAIVGGVLTGGIGVLVGGLTASKKQKDKIKSINLKITVNDMSNPIYKINFLNTEAKKGSFIYNTSYSQVERWHGVFSALINQNSSK